MVLLFQIRNKINVYMVIIFFVTCSYSSPRSSPSFFFFFLPQVGEGGKGPRPTHRVNHVHHHHITIFLSFFAIVPLPGIINTNPASPSLLIPCIWQRGPNGGPLAPCGRSASILSLSYLPHLAFLPSGIIHNSFTPNLAFSEWAKLQSPTQNALRGHFWL